MQRRRGKGLIAAVVAAVLVGTGMAAGALTGLSTPDTGASTAMSASGASGGTVVVAAGDIAEAGNATMANAMSTGDLAREINPALVMVLGDAAYNDGSTSDFISKYDPTWGSFKAISKPTPGNHEWHNLGQGYFDYFFGGNPTNWYAYDIDANWRAYALSCEVSCSGGSAQEQWLKADLAAHPGKHYIAYTHEPRYTSGAEHGDETGLAAIYADLVAAGGDIFLSGHNHTYERFAKMDGQGRTAPSGLRTFVVGTGGNQLYNFNAALHAGEEFRQNTDYGVLKLTLNADGYDWAFVASGRGWVNSTHVDTGRKGAVLDSGHETTNNPAPAGSVAGPPTTSAPASSSTLAPTTTAAAPTSNSSSTSSSTSVAPAGPTTTASRPTTTAKVLAAGGSGGSQLPSYIIDSHDPAAAARGFSVMDVSPGSLPDLPAGTRGMVWLGNLRSGCTWDTSDAQVTAFVAAHRGDPRIFGYNIADEPDDVSCATAPEMLRARTDLVHAADPAARTYAIITEPPTFARFAPTVDIPAIDPYPCRAGVSTCDLSQIDSYVKALKAAIGERPWWAVLQAFSSSPWRWPTPDEERALITRWCAAGPSGFTTFAWSYNGNSLPNQPDLLAVIEQLNRDGCSAFGGTPATPPPSGPSASDPSTTVTTVTTVTTPAPPPIAAPATVPATTSTSTSGPATTATTVVAAGNPPTTATPAPSGGSCRHERPHFIRRIYRTWTRRLEWTRNPPECA